MSYTRWARRRSRGRTLTTAAAAVGVALVVTGCSTPSDDTATGGGRATPTPTSTSTATSTTTSGSGADGETSATPTAVEDLALTGPGVEQYGLDVARQAAQVAHDLALAGMTDVTLLTPGPHDAAHYRAVTDLLSPAGLAAWQDVYTRAEAGDTDAVLQVDALALALGSDSAFVPDGGSPVAADPTVVVSPEIGLDTAVDTEPQMVVAVTVTVTYIGSEDGQRVTRTAVRDYTLGMSPTGDPDRPVAVDGWQATTDVGPAEPIT